jgi:Tfp pilus assembly PilM family ATPase
MFKKSMGKKNLVGLDIGSSSVKAVELTKKGSNLQLLHLGFENLQNDSIVDGQIMELNNVSNVISSIFNEHQIRTPRVAAGVSGHSVIVEHTPVNEIPADADVVVVHSGLADRARVSAPGKVIVTVQVFIGDPAVNAIVTAVKTGGELHG